jgi:cystathionine beta-lyase family protein involved in aluminum resistance
VIKKRNKKVSSAGLSDKAVDTMEKAFKETQKGNKRVCRPTKVKANAALTKALDELCEVGDVLKKATKNEINSKKEVVSSVKRCRKVTASLKTLGGKFSSEVRIVAKKSC